MVERQSRRGAATVCNLRRHLGSSTSTCRALSADERRDAIHHAASYQTTSVSSAAAPPPVPRECKLSTAAVAAHTSASPRAGNFTKLLLGEPPATMWPVQSIGGDAIDEERRPENTTLQVLVSVLDS